ncbi:hypothetical protein [Streptomyces sp. NPDC001530]|uniref:hypothetical protein n=1 Tax=Streptomyces sp. NPDC001530 TaxID=3364582 RepID=UPI0036D0129F
MRKVTKAAATLLLSVSLTIGLGQAAFAADGPSSHQGTASADVRGAMRSDLMSGSLDSSGASNPFHLGTAGPYYVNSDRSATAGGASSDVIASGFDANGGVYYITTHLMANNGGVTSSITQTRS